MPATWAEKILDFAIATEESAAKFYRHLANETNREDMKEVFLNIAREEDAHKAELLSIKAGKHHLLSEEKVVNLGLTDGLEDEPINLAGDINYAQALTIAIQSEQKSYDLYCGLAESTNDAACKSVLLGLAHEEAEHKLRFEREYNEHMRKPNER